MCLLVRPLSVLQGGFTASGTRDERSRLMRIHRHATLVPCLITETNWPLSTVTCSCVTSWQGEKRKLWDSWQWRVAEINRRDVKAAQWPRILGGKTLESARWLWSRQFYTREWDTVWGYIPVCHMSMWDLIDVEVQREVGLSVFKNQEEIQCYLLLTP